MNEEPTIAAAAEEALRILGRPASIPDIFQVITEQRLYVFNTPTPEHVLRTIIRRHTNNVERVDSSQSVRFTMTSDEVYSLTAPENRKEKTRKTVGTKRILRASDKEEIIQALIDDNNGIFREIWRLLLFAAQLGFQQGKREPLRSHEQGKGIDQSTFGNSSAWPGILYLLGLAENADPNSLANTPESEDRRIELFQEYANGGLAILREFFQNRPVSVDGMIAFMDTQRHTTLSSPSVELDLSI